MFGVGIDKTGYLVDMGVADGFIEKAGSFFTYKDERFQGKDKFKEYLANTPEVAYEIENLIREKHGCKKLDDMDIDTPIDAEVAPVKETKKEKKSKK